VNSLGNTKDFNCRKQCIKLSMASDLEVNKIFSFLNVPPKILVVQKMSFFSRISLLLMQDLSRPFIPCACLNQCQLVSRFYL
jgi:hypothetical protein